MSADLETWMRVRRTFPCWNTTNERIPSYAIMQLRKPKDFKETEGFSNTVDKDNFSVQHLSGGRIIWDVTKPNEDGEQRQCAEDFVFNGPIPIEPHSPGVCTQDYPCQVLHNGANDRLINGQSCGPVKDRWYVLSGGTAFSCKSHDVGFAIGTGAVHTVWLDRSSLSVPLARGRIVVAATDLEAEAYVQLGAGSLILNMEASGDWLTVERDGLYLISLNAKLTSSDAARGDGLSLSLYKKQADDADGTTHDPVATPYVVARDQDIERNAGTDIQTTAENVAFTGFESLARGDSIGLKNTCTKKLTLTSGILTIVRIGSKIEEDSTDGGGFDTSQS